MLGRLYKLFEVYFNNDIVVVALCEGHYARTHREYL